MSNLHHHLIPDDINRLHSENNRYQKVLTAICFFLSCSIVHAHGKDWIAPHSVDWRTKQISSVVSTAPFSTEEPGTRKIDGKICMTEPMLNVDIDDDYAFDLDEKVTVEIEFDLENNPPEITLNYDRNGGTPGTINITLPDKSENRWYRHRFTLERARFAGRPVPFQIHNGDFSIGASGRGFFKEPVVVCDIIITRSFQTPKSTASGKLSVKLLDENGSATSARVGIYNETGRMPLPSKDALEIRFKSLMSRSVTLWEEISWPVKNRFSFYIDENYQAILPAGKYEFVVTRGPEYRVERLPFEIKHGLETQLTIKLRRWTNMPNKDWYSGDVHIHYGRASADDNNVIFTQTRSEDLHLANILISGNSADSSYGQYNWGTSTDVKNPVYELTPGQEDPRSDFRGHTIMLNIDRPIRKPSQYYLYHKVFNEVHRQGGLAGYAHVQSPYVTGARVGLALDVPLGLVDFVEILQYSHVSLDAWFDFLNLGYKLSPAAGTDYSPLVSRVPGDVRTYVKVLGKFSAQAWFDGLKAGRVFVTNGPMLELSVNNKGLGADVHVKEGERITVTAKATLNPDLGQLKNLDLYQHGEKVAGSSSFEDGEALTLKFNTEADLGSWFVIVAEGIDVNKKGNLVAISAPVYVRVNGGGFCNHSAVTSLVSQQKNYMRKLNEVTVEGEYLYEFPDAMEMRKKYWPMNKVMLADRISEISKKYDELLILAEKQQCINN